ncbi:HIT family protein [Candidatus Falkowbacteria bacterium CG10_big_fil_rev_8_21_14_0_10_39_11]|uniref:HIT family protein n=1 Tax=Candidatus Falkowbacteria bacterium CG10_big_fil_rev_8_21_14_0_10_39_11 TaxID=1974565 RepID=A0A2H0V8M7_9BACT|nr:MAG: HIT family protein [Candidatus Falkowbacteria bacterium CG10_big_fil_rev_8_21_14_0_10_39_11]
MTDCIFCKIIAGEIPSYKVYEDDEFLGFLDIQPRNKGHVLVIPKKHVRWVWDVENIEGYFAAVKKIANAQRKAFDTKWVVSMVFGEEVPHAHVWLVPRFANDGHGGSIDLKNFKEFSSEQMSEFAQSIKSNM